MTEPDPRTDGWDEELEQELPAPSDEEVQAGVEHDRALAKGGPLLNADGSPFKGMSG
jgi:hypothetical protein